MLSNSTFYPSQKHMYTTKDNSLYHQDSILKSKESISPVQTTIHIPPLRLNDSSQKRMNLSDLGNPIQKKVKPNPEVSFETLSFLKSGTLSQPVPYSNQTNKSRVEYPYKVKHNLLKTDESAERAKQLQEALKLLQKKMIDQDSQKLGDQKKSSKTKYPESPSENHQVLLETESFKRKPINLNDYSSGNRKPINQRNNNMRHFENVHFDLKEEANSCSTSESYETGMRPWKNPNQFNNVLDVQFPARLAPEMPLYNYSNQDSLVIKPGSLIDWCNATNPAFASLQENPLMQFGGQLAQYSPIKYGDSDYILQGMKIAAQKEALEKIALMKEQLMMEEKVKRVQTYQNSNVLASSWTDISPLERLLNYNVLKR